MKTNQRKKRTIHRTQPKKLRILTFGVIVLLVLGTAGYLLATAFSSKTPPPAANTIDVSADLGGFSEDEIRVKAGRPVTVRLTSLDNSHHTDGGGQHQWAVGELSVSIVAPPLGNNWATFTPDKSGVYSFYCDICCGGRANPSMQGKLVVEA
jgi:heme/copper-type cytochrome/quinol oxidase subunit 2